MIWSTGSQALAASWRADGSAPWGEISLHTQPLGACAAFACGDRPGCVPLRPGWVGTDGAPGELVVAVVVAVAGGMIPDMAPVCVSCQCWPPSALLYVPVSFLNVNCWAFDAATDRAPASYTGTATPAVLVMMALARSPTSISCQWLPPSVLLYRPVGGESGPVPSPACT